MEDEDEIDVLGEFNLENLLTKDEQQMVCYEGEHQLGLNCDSSWILDSSQSCWYETKSDPQPHLEECTSVNSLENTDDNIWSDKERYLLEKGLELFGRSWSRLAQYIGTKTSSQVKSYVKSLGIGWSGKSSVSTSNFGVGGTDFNFSEIIDDMEIPASMEEVIAVVSTAQPTVVVPSSQRETNTVQSHSLTKKKCRKRKKISSGSKKNQVFIPRYKETAQIYNAEDIKDVLTGITEQDSIVLPNGEEVMRIRHGSSLSEDSDVDIDVNSDSEKKECIDHKVCVDKYDLSENEDSKPIKEEILYTQAESVGDMKEEYFEFKENSIIDFSDLKNEELFITGIENEVSVFTERYIEDKTQADGAERETQVFKGNLVTPSGKVMTVVVDDLSNGNFPTAHVLAPIMDTAPSTASASARYSSELQEKLDAVYRLPPPTHESVIQPHIVTREEQLLHPEFFIKTFHGLNRYLKIRNYIIDCWKNSKPNYVSKTSVRAGLRSCGDVNLISRIHAYLEYKGFINFGCEQCHYNKNSTTDAFQKDLADEVCSVVEVNSSWSPTSEGTVVEDARPMVESAKRGSSRVSKKKIPFEVKHDRAKKTPAQRLKKPGTRMKKTHKNNSLRMTPFWRPQKSLNNNFDEAYTVVQTVNGGVIVRRNKGQQSNKVLTRGIRPVRLIHCKNYCATKKAPYKVELEVSVLLLVDVHSHLSPKFEVIGLLGGEYRSDDNVLVITMAVPCRTLLSSNIHCDMCPVSQCESSEMITGQGLSVVGWYHSHPNFDPSPSDTDVDTQNTLQSWFNDSGQPFVGLIISPYFPTNDVSYYRCCQVEMENSTPVPYQLEVKVVNLDGKSGFSLKQSIEASFHTLQKYEPLRQLNVFKCLESLRHHLRRASPKVSEAKVSELVKEVREIIRDGGNNPATQRKMIMKRKETV